MIKIAHIITRMDFGGAHKIALYLVEHVRKTHFDLRLLSGPGGTRNKIPEGVNYTQISELRREINPFYDYMAYKHLYSYFRTLAPDIVHTHTSKAGIIARLAAKAAGVPIIVHTVHGWGFNSRQLFPLRESFVLAEKYCASFTDTLVFVSESNMKEAERRGIGSPEKYNLIRAGIHLNDYPSHADKAGIRASLGVPRDAVMVYYIGNTKKQKNPGDFIEAASRIIPGRPDVYFVFSGGGEKLAHYRAEAEKRGLGGRFIFTDWREDAADILAASDIYAMTSLWEGLPISLVEAFASGVPAVCYRADGIADILKDGENGFSVPCGDVSGFCDRLSKMIDDAGTRSGLAEGAKNMDLKEFDLDYTVQQYETLYRKVVDRTYSRYAKEK